MEHSGHRARLRESFLARGLQGVHEHQILELLLTFAIPRKDTNPLAHSLIKRFGSLKDVLNANAYDLMQTEGIGESAAVLLSLVGQISRKKDQGREQNPKLLNPDAAMRYCQDRYGENKYECFYVISLDVNRRVLYDEMISSGTLTETAVYPRLAVESALRHKAHSVILCHNHPSGDVRPSNEDIESTQMILNALSAIGIHLNDHIITGPLDSYSMKGRKQLFNQDVELPSLQLAERMEP